MRTLRDVTPTAEQLAILLDAAPGFRLIRGTAGSGKTTAALLRLRQLCRSRIERRARQGTGDPVRVLVLTFNRTLRGYVNQLATEHVHATDELDLTVETFGRWARGLVGGRLIPDGDGSPVIGPLLAGMGLPAGNLDYFADEVRYLQGRFPKHQLDRYLAAVRSGRGRAPAVPRELRHRLLADVVQPYEAWKAERNMADWNDIALRAADAPFQGYDIVIVDESQDLSANQVRAILAHLNEDHVTTFVIDAVQRIYPQGFQWNEVGINMRPESVFTLGRNYRNTVEIARLASSLVRGLPADPDGVLPDEGACQEHGPRPEVVSGTFSEQIDYMLRQVHPSVVSGETVAILHPRGGRWFDFTREKLRGRGMAFCELTRSREWPTGPELVALSTVHSAKGLEFDHVLMPGLSSEVTPHGDEEGDGTLDSLRRLVAMGVGRAIKTVRLGYKPGEQSTVFQSIDPATYDLIEF
jgi:superfamily I DNA/RNA helicase